jgi:hypothetical protein
VALKECHISSINLLANDPLFFLLLPGMAPCEFPPRFKKEKRGVIKQGSKKIKLVKLDPKSVAS